MPRPHAPIYTTRKELRAAVTERCLEMFEEHMGEAWSTHWAELFVRSDAAVRVEREAARFLGLGRRRDDVLARIRQRALTLPPGERMFATTVVVRMTKTKMPRWGKLSIAMSTRVHLVNRFRLGYPNKFHHAYNEKLRSASFRTISAVSILSGNQPHLSAPDLKLGVKVSDFIRREELAIRQASARLDQVPARSPVDDPAPDTRPRR